jgi:WD40 repeat protein
MTNPEAPPNPYVGLRPFDHSDSLYFFGRRVQVAELLQQLHATRFLAVVGSSGCGKSSLIRAGLIPALLGGFLVEERDRWLVAKLRPGGGPIANFAQALCEVAEADPKPEDVAKLKTAIEDNHLEAVRDYLKPRVGTDANVLILLDQFEEIFSFRGSESDDVAESVGREERRERAERHREAADFVDLALELAHQSEIPVYVVLTMRSDFLGDCDLFYGLPEAMNLSRYLVPRLSRAQLREAIEGPPMLMGQRLAPRLVDALLNELGDRHDRLPILQHALMRSYDVWVRKGASGPIDLEHYEDAGSLQNALPRHANEALGEDVDSIARIFACLTDTDLNRRRVRRRASVSELVSVCGLGQDEVEAILERFNEDGRNFLWLSPSADGADVEVEISHESLIRQWDQLARWVDEERDARDQFHELVDRSRRSRALLRDPDLQIALNWRETAQPTEAWAERYSAQPGDLQIALDYLERSHQAKSKHQSRRRRRRIVEVTGTLVVGAALSILSVRALDNASEARDTARVAIASDWMRRDPTQAALVMLEVQQPQRSRFAASTMLAVLQKPIAQAVLRGHEGRVEIVAFSPDGTHVVTASDDTTARVWSSDGSGRPVVLRGHDGWVRSAEFSPDGRRVVTASDDGTARIWAIDGSAKPIVLRGHDGAVATASFAAGGERVVTAGSDATARVWRADGRGGEIVLAGHEGAVVTALFSRDGSQVLTASEDGTARIFPSDGDGEEIVLTGHVGSVSTASFSRDGRKVVTSSADGTSRIWNADGSGEHIVLGKPNSLQQWVEFAEFSPDGSQVLASYNDASVKIWNSDGEGDPIELRATVGFGFQGRVRNAAFSPDGEWIATASGDGTARIWTADADEEPIVLQGHTARVAKVKFSPDGTMLATGSDDGTARIWRIGNVGEPVMLEGHDDWVADARFSRDGQRVLTASHDGSARLWGLENGEEALVLDFHTDELTAVAFGPNGRYFVTASVDQNSAIWDSENLGEPIALVGHEGAIRSTSFSPDGTRILTAADDGTARIWSLEGGSDPIVLEGHQGSISTAAWSLDGSHIATGSSDKTARIWSADGSGETVVLRGHERKVETIVFSPDGLRVLTASGDETARLWNADGSGEPIVMQHSSWVSSAAFSPDGRLVVTASDDRRARVWNSDGSGEPVHLLGHKGQVGSAAFSPDGRHIVTGSVDQTARVWLVGSSADPLVLKGHSGRLTTAVFSEDGSRILTASTDGTARVWAYAPAALQRSLSSMTTACLDASFRRHYLNESEHEAQDRFANCEKRLVD